MVHFSNMKIGDVLNVTGTSLMSRLIMFITRSKYSHSACYAGGKKIIESDWGGVSLKFLSEKTKYDIYRHMHATEHQIEIAVDWMIAQAGAKYDFRALVFMGANRLRMYKRNKQGNKKKFWCTELIADGYLIAKIPLNVNFDTFKVSPEDLSRDERMMIIASN